MKERGMGRVYRRGKVWWVEYWHRGKQYRESGGSTDKGVALKVLKQRLGEMGQGRLPKPDAEKVTLGDLESILLDDYKVNERRSIERVKDSLVHLRDFFVRESRAVDITADRLTAYRATRRDEGASPATARYELACLKRAFNLAIAAGRLVQKPTFPAITVNNTRTGFFEEAEFRGVLSHLPQDVQPVAEFMYLTGWRKSEALSLQWRQVDFGAGIVRLDPGTTKNREGRVLPFHALPELAEVLNRQRERTSALEQANGVIVPWVFHRDGEAIRYFRRSWVTACRKAGVPNRIPHDFRRTAARNLIRAGVPERIAMTILGHRTRSIFDRYNIVNEADLAEGLSKLARAREAGPTTARPKVQAIRAAN